MKARVLSLFVAPVVAFVTVTVGAVRSIFVAALLVQLFVFHAKSITYAVYVPFALTVLVLVVQ